MNPSVSIQFKQKWLGSSMPVIEVSFLVVAVFFVMVATRKRLVDLREDYVEKKL